MRGSARQRSGSFSHRWYVGPRGAFGIRSPSTSRASSSRSWASRRRRTTSSSLAEVLRPHGLSGVYVFTRETKDASSVAHARYFVPGIGVAEDPVTGSAAGPLGMYLATRGLLALPAEGGTVRARIEQGDAIGKPGRIEVEVTGRAGAPEQARIGGVAVTVIEGTLRA